MTDNSILTYIALVTLMVITPGPNAALILRTVGARGRATGFGNLAGIVSGFYFHAMCSALGLSLLLVRSPELYTAVKWLGAAYLVYLGIKTLRQAFYSNGAGNAPAASTSAFARVRNAYFEGLLTNVLNPKVALFYLSLFPQFIKGHDAVMTQSLMLVSIHAALNFLWFSSITLLFDKFGAYLGSSHVKRNLQATTSVILIGLGIKIAVSSG
jgi:RhtB (resistance to homoserine/threonine) family protein